MHCNLLNLWTIRKPVGWRCDVHVMRIWEDWPFWESTINNYSVTTDGSHLTSQAWVKSYRAVKKHRVNITRGDATHQARPSCSDQSLAGSKMLNHLCYYKHRSKNSLSATYSWWKNLLIILISRCTEFHETENLKRIRWLSIFEITWTVTW